VWPSSSTISASCVVRVLFAKIGFILTRRDVREGYRHVIEHRYDHAILQGREVHMLYSGGEI
jgi:hypothetical protein